MSIEDAGNTAGTATPAEQTGAEVVKPEAATTSLPQGEKTEGETPPEKPLKKEGGVSKRIRELVSDRDHWRNMAMKSQGIEQEREVADGKPDVSKYESYDKYLEDVSGWRVRQELKTEREKGEKESQKRASQEYLRQSKAVFDERAEDFREAHDDFDEVAFAEDLSVSTAMTEAILDSDLGPQILYHLGHNPKEAGRIARLSPYAAAREIGKLEAKLSTPTPKKPSKAPEPINPVGGKSGVDSSLPQDSDDTDTWIKKERARLRAKK